jgi:hypothetical protein
MIRKLRRRRVALGLALAASTSLAGCASECPGEPGPGSYLVELSYRTGTCTQDPISYVVVDDGSSDPPDDDCVTLEDDSDACGEAKREVCDEYNDADQYTGSSSWTWSLDYVDGGLEGLLSIAYDTTQSDCYGTYDVAITPL